MVKKGFLKKTGCILISASIILAGWTFAGSSVSEAELDDVPGLEETVDVEETDELDSIDTTTEDVGSDETAETEEQLNETADVPEDGAVAAGDSADGDAVAADDAISADVPATDGVGEEVTTTEVTEENTVTTSLGTTMLRSAAPMRNVMLLASSTDDDDSTATAEYSGSTLVNVPAEVGTTFTIKSGTTTIAAGAFSDSNVNRLTFNDASSITSIGNQGGWPADGTKVYCPNDTIDECPTVVSYFTSLINSSRNIEIIFADSEGDEESYTLTIYTALEDADGTPLPTSEASQVLKVFNNAQVGDEYTYPAPNPYKYKGVNYYLVDDQDATIAGTVSKDETYVLTYRAESPSETKYTITINYELQDSSGNVVKTITAETVEVKANNTPSHSYPSTYDYNDVTYKYTSGPTPAFAAVTADATYKYVYKATSSPSPSPTPTKDTFAITINYLLQDANGKTVATVLGNTLSCKKDQLPKYDCPTSYKYNGKTYNFASGPSPAFKVVTGDATYTYTFKLPSSSGGSSSSSSSSSGGGSATTNKPTDTSKPYASDAAQKNMAYKVIKGANQSVAQDAGAVTITCDGPVDKFMYLLMDGNIVATSNYTIQSGSTIATFTKEFIASLSVADHVVQFQYNDGYALTGLKITPPGTKTTTTVSYKVAADGTISSGHTKDSTPKTADGFDSRYLLCIAIFLMGAGSIMMSKQRKLEAILADRFEE